jgi:hypothetical protein
LPPGSYSTTGQDLTVNPGSESYLPAGPLKIHLENNRVDSIKDNEGKPLPEFEFASELDLPNKEKFLPIDPRLQIPDYNTPFWLRDPHDHTFAMEQPPAWLSVLGRNDFWPLAALNCYSLSDATQNHGPPCIHTDPGIWETARRATESLGKTLAFWNAKTAYHEEQTEHNPSWAPMPLSMKVALCLLFIWASFHFVCCLLPSITAKPNHRAYFVCFSHSFRTHRALLVAGSLALSSTATVLAFGYGAMYREGPPLLHAVQCLALLPSLWLIAGSALVVNLWKLRSVRPLDRKGEFSEATAPPQGETESRRFQNRLSRVLPTPGWARSLTDYLAPRWPFLWPPLAYVAGTLGFYFWLYYSSERVLTFANRVPFYLRSMNLTNGVSPVVPIIALTVGAYMWVWHSLQGLAFFGPDVPALPTNASLQFPGEGKTMLDRLRMFSREHAGAPVEALCWPFARGIAYAFIAFLASMIVIAMVLSTRGEEPIRSLGARSYAQLLCLLVAASVSLMLANAWQLLHIWSRLRRLLVHLDRVPMRRSMAAFPGVSWGSVWKISGNVFDMRYKLLVSQLETLTHLQNSMATTKMSECAFWNGPRCYEKVDDAISRLQHTRNEFSKWYVENCDKTKVYGQEKLKTLQESLAEVAGQIVAWMLLPAWRMENEDLLPKVTSPVGEKADEEDENKSATGLQLAPHIRHAEKFVCFVYLGFIQNTLGRMRTLVVGVLCLFISSTISLASYPFDPRPVVNGAMVLLFLALGAAIVHVYAQMHRDPILSLVTNTKPGALDGDFWIKLVGFGAGPVIGLIATLFPQLTDFLFSWVAPGISSAK